MPRQSMTALRLDEVQHGIAAAESEEAIQFLKDRGIMNFILQRTCHSVPQILSDGRIELSEQWQWLNGDKSKGSSIVIEKTTDEK